MEWRPRDEPVTRPKGFCRVFTIGQTARIASTYHQAWQAKTMPRRGAWPTGSKRNSWDVAASGWESGDVCLVDVGVIPPLQLLRVSADTPMSRESLPKTNRRRSVVVTNGSSNREGQIGSPGRYRTQLVLTV
jgi:hypothetical protein